MKTLLIMRHAKSDWGAASSRDHDRPLAERGVKAARRMGRFLAETDAVPELVISSTAVRALTTAELVADAGEWSCPIVADEALYASDPESVLKVIGAIEPGIDRLLIIGHEPTWSVLVTWLIGGGRLRMPTAAVACLDQRRGNWNGLGPDSCELRWLVTPKMIKGV